MVCPFRVASDIGPVANGVMGVVAGPACGSAAGAGAAGPATGRRGPRLRVPCGSASTAKMNRKRTRARGLRVFMGVFRRSKLLELERRLDSKTSGRRCPARAVGKIGRRSKTGAPKEILVIADDASATLFRRLPRRQQTLLPAVKNERKPLVRHAEQASSACDAAIRRL